MEEIFPPIESQILLYSLIPPHGGQFSVRPCRLDIPLRFHGGMLTYLDQTQMLIIFFKKTGITLLVILPLGAVLCFFDLLGARAFSRGELALQTRFHSPLLVHPTPYPPRPIFTRYREPTTAELETGRPLLTRNGMVCERSFYKNTYAMVSQIFSCSADSCEFNSFFVSLPTPLHIKPYSTSLSSSQPSPC